MCEWPALGMPWATARSNAACAVVSRSGGACTGGCARLCRWFARLLPVLSHSGVLQWCRLCSATTAHRALPVCEWPALGMPWATARSNAACAVVSRSGGSCTGGCGTAVQVVCVASGFVTFWSPSVMEHVLRNHWAQSPASVWVAIPGHSLGPFNVKCSLCSGQQVCWSLHWGLQHCCAA